MRAAVLSVLVVLFVGAFVALRSRIARADPPAFLTCEADCRAEQRRCENKCRTGVGGRDCALDCRAGGLDCRTICVCDEASRQGGALPPMCRSPGH